MTKVMVKKHKRNGITVESHERDVSETVSESLSDKLRKKSETRKKKLKLNNLLFGGDLS